MRPPYGRLLRSHARPSVTAAAATALHPRADRLAARFTPPQFRLLPLGAAASAIASASLDTNLPESFDRLGYSSEVSAALAAAIRSRSASVAAAPRHAIPANGARAPPATMIQSLVARAYTDYSNDKTPARFHALLVAAETGSGKTLAYLAPVFDLLRRDEEHHAKATESHLAALAALRRPQQIQTPDTERDVFVDPETARRPRPVRRVGHPRAIVLVPSLELVAQVGAVAKSLSHTARLRVAALTSSAKPARIRATLAESPIDVLVTTPVSLLRFMRLAGGPARQHTRTDRDSSFPDHEGARNNDETPQTPAQAATSEAVRAWRLAGHAMEATIGGKDSIRGHDDGRVFKPAPRPHHSNNHHKSMSTIPTISLASTRVLAIDEADFMADQGFAGDLAAILAALIPSHYSTPPLSQPASDETANAAIHTSPLLLFAAATVPATLVRGLHHLLEIPFLPEPSSSSSSTKRKIADSVSNDTSGASKDGNDVGSALDPLASSSSRDALRIVTSPALHMPTCALRFIDVPRDHAGNKHNALLAILGHPHPKHPIRTREQNNTVNLSVPEKTIIFCNTTNSADALYTFLTATCNIQALKLTGDLLPSERRTVLTNFSRSATEKVTNTEKQDVGTPAAATTASTTLVGLSACNILVSTDVGSRGVDLPVDRVISFDFPRCTADFLHRAGRAGRTPDTKTKAIAVCLVTKLSRELAVAIKQRLGKRRDLAIEASK